MPDNKPDPIKARNDDVDVDADADEELDGQVANPGPVPAEAEDMSDTGEEPGDLAPERGPERDN